MKSRDIARVGLLALGLSIGSLTVSAPDIARSDTPNALRAGSGAVVINSDGSAQAGGRQDYTQRLGCEKASKPTCNKPGRRSTRR